MPSEEQIPKIVFGTHGLEDSSIPIDWDGAHENGVGPYLGLPAAPSSWTPSDLFYIGQVGFASPAARSETRHVFFDASSADFDAGVPNVGTLPASTDLPHWSDMDITLVQTIGSSPTTPDSSTKTCEGTFFLPGKHAPAGTLDNNAHLQDNLPTASVILSPTQTAHAASSANPLSDEETGSDGGLVGNAPTTSSPGPITQPPSPTSSDSKIAQGKNKGPEWERIFDVLNDPDAVVPVSSDPVQSPETEEGNEGGPSPAATTREDDSSSLSEGFTMLMARGETAALDASSRMLMPPPASVVKSIGSTTVGASTEGKGAYVCQALDCGASFNARSALAYHFAAEHQDETEVVVMGWEGTWTVERRQALSGDNLSKDRVFHCPKCVKAYKTPVSLKKHAIKCEGPKPQPNSEANAEPPKVTLELIRNRRKKKEEAAARPFEMPNCNQTTPWAKRSRFLVLLNGQRLEDYAAATDLPQKGGNQDEIALCDLTAAAIREAADRLASVSIIYAQLMNATDVSNTHMTRPMNAKPTTLDGYIKIAQRLILFCARVQHSITDSESDNDEGGETKLVKVKKALQGDPVLRGMISRLMANQGSEIIWEIGEHLLSAPLSDGSEGSVLSFFLAAIGIRRPVNGTFLSPGDYTPSLSKLLYCLRLCWFWHHGRSIWRANGSIASVPATRTAAEEFGVLHTDKLGPGAPFTSGSKHIQGLRAFGLASARVSRIHYHMNQ
ncbi:hypothetical protein CF319_g8972 [Tilletia indica]|nr:hypothetical protein CF319_g8972 [Tilletia indica]